MSATHAEELADQSNRLDEAAIHEAPAVFRVLWADPQYMPEHLALWSLKHGYRWRGRRGVLGKSAGGRPSLEV